jgi:ABC-2 type transport system permease protein
MFNLISIEVYKIFSKWRTYISFIAIGVIGLIIQLAFYFQGEQYLNHFTQNMQDRFVFVGNFMNGYLITYIIMGSLILQIPFLIALVSGDLLASEATGGTYRLLITRPVSRFSILLAKFIAGEVYTLAVIIFFAIMTLGLGLLIFGSGELLVLTNKIIIFKSDDVLWRFAVAFAFAFLSMSVITSLSFLFSSFVENAIGPIVSTMAVIFVFIIVSALNFDFVDVIRPYLFTSHIMEWRAVFNNPADIDSMLNSSLILLIHIIVFFTIATVTFRKKDILS